jgi:outer membrane protein assembly factor BamB
MLTVRLGSTWKQEPTLRAALAHGGAAAVREATEAAVDALVLEVDGVDVAGGRAEGALVPAMHALGEGVLRLLLQGGRAQVHFAEGGIELLLARRGASALLTVVSLARPARVLARDVEIELAELARAAREAAEALAADLALLGPGARGLADPLAALAARLASARAADADPPAHPPEPRRRARRHGGGPTCTFVLHDEEDLIASYRGPGADLGSLLAPGRVVVRTADGREVLAVEGAPFLVLRDLAAFAGRVADGVRRGDASASADVALPGRHASAHLELDLGAGALSRDGGALLPCPPLALARALLEGAVDLCGVVAARNPWQATNGWLSELRTAADERLAHVHELSAGDVVGAGEAPVRRRRARRLPRAPLGPGRVRRLAFRRAWACDVGAPAGVGLALAGDAVLAAGASAVLALDARSGEVRWRRSGAALALLHDGALYALDDARLAAMDPVSGRERWSRRVEALPEGGVRDVVRLGGGLALALGPGVAAALHPATGRAAWTFAPPAARRLAATALGGIALVGSDAGFLYGVEAASGRAAWRVKLPGVLAAPPYAFGDAALAVCATDLGGTVLALDPATGRRRFEVPLDAAPQGSPVPFAGLLAVPCAVAGDPVIAALDPAAARLAWEDAPPLAAGRLGLAALPQGLLAATPSGACAALDRGGDVRWTRAAGAGHPAPSAAAPVVARGVALVPDDGVAALDAATGVPLGRAPMPPPVRLVADAALRLWGMDVDGVVTALRLETHLSVV